MNKKEGVHPRKTRSDKKVQAAPYIKDEQRVWIYRIARKVELPEGEVASRLVAAALNDEACIAYFRTYFKRPYQWREQHVMYPGLQPGNVYDVIDMNHELQSRFKMKFNQTCAERITEFQIALSLSYFAHTVKVLLEYALQNVTIIQQVAPGIMLRDFRMTLPSGKLNAQPAVWSIFK